MRHARRQFDGVGLLCVTHAVNLMGLVFIGRCFVERYGLRPLRQHSRGCIVVCCRFRCPEFKLINPLTRVGVHG